MNYCIRVLLFAVLATTAVAQSICWQKSYKRTIYYKDSCEPGWENYLDACYGPCPAGYLPYHDICYQNVTCKDPFVDAEESCIKPPSYSRPAYPLFEEETCVRNHPEGCELVGPLWMPKCKAGYHGVFTECVASCPPGYDDELTSCLKPHRSRQEKPHICPPGTSEESPGEDFCYKDCDPNNKGFGQVCWGKCPNTHKQCSEALCVKSNEFEEECTPELADFLEETYEDVDFYLHVTPGEISLQTALNVVTGMNHNMCATVGSFRKRHIKID